MSTVPKIIYSTRNHPEFYALYTHEPKSTITIYLGSIKAGQKAGRKVDWLDTKLGIRTSIIHEMVHFWEDQQGNYTLYTQPHGRVFKRKLNLWLKKYGSW